MPTCGNCQKEVASSDVTCPHCGVLLAAYASPIGSGPAESYQAPPPPPSADIPSVDMDVKPPSEAEIVTDPTQVAEEAISTAPRPLFDTYLTVEEIARAAEGDHAEDVVTISDKKVATKPVEFDVPDYAKPPADAAPIPTIEDDDASIPLITRDDGAANKIAEATPAPEPVEATPPPVEEWLHTPQPEVTPNPKATTVAEAAADSGPIGTTDAYLRKLHSEAGYTPSQTTISKPVEAGRPAASTRAERFFAAQRAPRRKRYQEEGEETKVGASAVYLLVLFILWFGIIASLTGGRYSIPLIFLTVILTWAYKPVMNFLDDMKNYD